MQYFHYFFVINNRLGFKMRPSRITSCSICPTRRLATKTSSRPVRWKLTSTFFRVGIRPKLERKELTCQVLNHPLRKFKMPSIVEFSVTYSKSSAMKSKIGSWSDRASNGSLPIWCIWWRPTLLFMSWMELITFQHFTFEEIKLVWFTKRPFWMELSMYFRGQILKSFYSTINGVSNWSMKLRKSSVIAHKGYDARHLPNTA